MVTVDGGDCYWNPHPGDDPMAMVIGELIPLCQRLGLGRSPRSAPAIWTSYAQARQANSGAYAFAAAFAAGDAVTHAAALSGIPVRVASGYDDPFYPGVRALARALPAGAVLDFAPGCHTTPFFLAQEPPSLAVLAGHLAR